MAQTTTRTRVRAAAIGKAAPAQKVLAFVAHDESVLSAPESVTALAQSSQLVNHTCGDCGTKIVASVHTPSPFCTCCGSDKVTATSKPFTVERVAASDQHLASMRCTCGAVNVFQSSVLRAAAGEAHCASCGAEMHVAASADDINLDPVTLNDGNLGVTDIDMTSADKENAKENADAESDEDLDDAFDDLQELTTASVDNWPFRQSAAAEDDESDKDDKSEDAPKEDDKPSEDKKEDEPAKEEAAEDDKSEDAPKDDKPAEDEKEDDKPAEDKPSEDKKDDEPAKEDANLANFKGKQAAPFGKKQSADAFDDLPFDDDTDPAELMVDADEDFLGDDVALGVDSDLSLTPTDLADNDDVLSFDDNFGSTPDMTPTASGEVFMDMGTPGSDYRVAPHNDMAIANADEMPMDKDGDPIMDAEDMDDSVKSCFLIQAGDELLMLKGKHVVASLSPSAAGANAKVMHTDGFAEAVIASAQEQGLRKALASFHFEPVRIKTRTVASVRREVSSVRNTMAQEAAKRDAVMADCFALAAVGLARGMWKGKPNPLKAAFETEMSRLGMRKPGRVAAALFAQHGIEYSRVLCSLASTLASKSEEHRRELADTLDLVSEDPIADLPIDADGYDAVSDDGFDSQALAGSDEMVSLDDLEGGPSVTLASRLSAPGFPHRSHQTAALLKPRTGPELDVSASASDMLSGAAPLFSFSSK